MLQADKTQRFQRLQKLYKKYNTSVQAPLLLFPFQKNGTCAFEKRIGRIKKTFSIPYS